MISIWKDSGVLGNFDFKLIQSKIDCMIVPFGIGRIPYKVFSKFSELTADQWRNWTNVFSLFGLLPDMHYSCWTNFVQASLILSQSSITADDLLVADSKLLEFCKCFENLYGRMACTPNMHLHAHLRQSIVDYGPTSAFWAFPFEHFNGVMGSFIKNWMTPEMQMMKRFISYQNILTCTSDSLQTSEIDKLLQSCVETEGSFSGSLQSTMLDVYNRELHSRYCYSETIDAVLTSSNHKIMSKCYEGYLNYDDIVALSHVYHALYPMMATPSPVPRKHLVCTDIEVH